MSAEFSEIFEILRDSIWGFVIGLVVIILMIIIYKLQRRRKTLSYEIVSNTPLFNVHGEIKGRLQVIFDGKPINDKVHLVMVKIINSGNTPIKPDDYIHPISVNLGESAQILASEVYKTNPENIEASIKFKLIIEEDSNNPNIATMKSEVILNPTLLNGGDSITLKILTTQIADDIIVDGRIVGVKKINTRHSTIRFAIGDMEVITDNYVIFIVFIIFIAFYIFDG